MPSQIVFAHTRHWYDSYVDYRKLIELSEFETCFIDEIDLKRECIYIVSPINGEIRPHIDNSRAQVAEKDRKAKIIAWNIERPDDGMDVYIRDTKQFREHYVDEMWFSDKWLAEQTEQKFVIIGGHPDFGQPSENKSKDFIHICSVYGRRKDVFDQFEGWAIGDNSWGEQRDKELKMSRFMISIHKDENFIIEPLRFAIAACYGLPIISEECHNSYPYVPGKDYTMSPFAHMVNTIKGTCAADYEPYKQMGLRLREKMTMTYNFRKMVEEACQ